MGLFVVCTYWVNHVNNKKETFNSHIICFVLFYSAIVLNDITSMRYLLKYTFSLNLSAKVYVWNPIDS